MSAAATGRVGRFYTAARRRPWVLGKVADWRIPLGPYTPAQLTVAVGGGFLLVKTISWWSWMGPLPVAGWLLATWAVRRPKIKGRAPIQAAWGWVLLAWLPAGGRIGGRAARDLTPVRCSALSPWKTRNHRLHHRPTQLSGGNAGASPSPVQPSKRTPSPPVETFITSTSIEEHRRSQPTQVAGFFPESVQIRSVAG
ncbi:hypothetical protein ACFTY7_16550 [Streptomyces sp. NPDC057062]|uniref:hypothetical protein n=1 Tax=Streptomyces sp. NPDC057062 TaxID=3346011 RepID=UPI003630F871